MKTGIVMMSRN